MEQRLVRRGKEHWSPGFSFNAFCIHIFEAVERNSSDAVLSTPATAREWSAKTEW